MPASSETARRATPEVWDAGRWIGKLEADLRKACESWKPKVAEALISSFRVDAIPYLRGIFEPIDRPAVEKSVGPLAKEETHAEALQRRLALLWADHRLWCLVRKLARSRAKKGAARSGLTAFITEHYGISLDFDPTLWLELLAKPQARGQLFALMVSMPAQFFPSRHDETAGTAELSADPNFSEKALGSLLSGYVRSPGNDFRPSLFQKNFSATDLERLRAAAQRLAADAQWCARNPGRFEARRARGLGHRVRSLEDARRIEEMVETLRKQPDLTDYSLAKSSLGSLSSNARKLANDARLLACYRDQVPVKFHRSRGDKSS